MLAIQNVMRGRQASALLHAWLPGAYKRHAIVGTADPCVTAQHRAQAKLGFPATVAGMTHEIVAADRADAAVKISLEGMTAGYMVELTEITNAMVTAGYYSDANEIAKVCSGPRPLACCL